MLNEDCAGRLNVVQIYGLKPPDSSKKPRVAMRISDGCYSIRCLSYYIPELKNFDVVNVAEYKLVNLKEGNVIIQLSKVEILYTDVKRLIGSPVDHLKANINEETIGARIPESAKCLEQPSDNDPTQEEREEPPKEYIIQSSSEVKGVMPIKALGLHSSDWTIKVRLIRKGELKKFTREKYGESHLLPLEFIDSEGTQICATLFSSGVDKYQSILTPLSCYLVSNGTVKMANKNYTSVRNDFAITLDATVAIQPVADDPSIPRAGYCFMPIVKIAEVASGTMIDIIGVVRTVREVTEFGRRDGTHTVRRGILLCDDSGHEIEVTMWGALAEGNYSVDDIVAFKGVRVSDYNGKQLNTTSDTMITKDPEHERTKELRSWRANKEDLELVSLTNKSVSAEDMLMLAEVIKSGETLDADPKGMMCWVSGSIIMIMYDKGFYYMGCKKCKKKVPDSVCDRCKEEAIPYYMFNMKISDGTDSVWVHVFGEQGEALVKKPVGEMMKLQEKDSANFKQTFDKTKGDVTFPAPRRCTRCS